MLDILLRRSAAPSDAEGRAVTCFLRASYEPLPLRFQQGILHLVDGTASWAPGVYGRGQRIDLSLPLTVSRTRPVGGRGEWNIKRQLFEIIEAESDGGLTELAVPKASIELVSRSISGSR